MREIDVSIIESAVENEVNVVVAAGNNGAVPEAYIVAVKLKSAKKYLRDYYFVEDGAIAYQENDIMLAINYVKSVALKLNMPISLCLTLGTNGRSHDGASSLSYIIDRFVSNAGTVASVCVGDEGNKQLHASGVVGHSDEKTDNQDEIEGNKNRDNKAYDVVEVRVDEKQGGLIINIWATLPGIISIGVVSPTGEVINPVEPRIGKSEIYNLIFDFWFICR